jgi:hypothetical protein
LCQFEEGFLLVNQGYGAPQLGALMS